ncbi:kinetochore Sim4 complex subunit FTA2-domain-containing protein [Xylariomycetidae sp. FL2044]|nr:kinetochore Sim4 complex subunit FTA2-domain-containing protein [Xylariomycetidae sp. FL2044]
MSSLAAENRRLLSLEELPPGNDPKLHRFPGQDHRIEFISVVQRNAQSVGGAEGYVFIVRIEGRIYALKVFKFFKPSDGKQELSKRRYDLVTDEEAAFHVDPFFAECRAYGRIKERQKDGTITEKIAAECYGFLGLGNEYESKLVKMGIHQSDLWDIPEDDDYRMRATGSPIRAIVKEYIEDETVFKVGNCRKMLAHLRLLKDIGITHRDIREDNYKGGLLVDFGSTYTEPHCIMNIVPLDIAEGWRLSGFRMFDQILENHKLDGRMRALPSVRRGNSLRSYQKKTQSG